MKYKLFVVILLVVYISALGYTLYSSQKAYRDFCKKQTGENAICRNYGVSE